MDSGYSGGRTNKKPLKLHQAQLYDRNCNVVRRNVTTYQNLLLCIYAKIAIFHNWRYRPCNSVRTNVLHCDNNNDKYNNNNHRVETSEALSC